MKASTINRCVL